MTSQRVVLCFVALSLSACTNGSRQSSNPTWYEDIEPLISSRCTMCHVENGYAPFTLTSYQDVKDRALLVRHSTESYYMPPWRAAREGCLDADGNEQQYVGDFSLTDDEIALIGDWVERGALEGDPSEAPSVEAVTETLKPGLSYPAHKRLDFETNFRASMDVAYQPQTFPDEWRCFVVDWPHDTVQYINGSIMDPYGDLSGINSERIDEQGLVHHMAAVIVPPDLVSTVEELDAADPDPGYICNASPLSNNGGSFGDLNFIGAHVPGFQLGSLPPGVGFRVEPGSKIVLSVHYSLSYAQSLMPVQSAIELIVVDPAVEEIAMDAWAFFDHHPDWPNGDSMLIPAGEKRTFTYEYHPAMRHPELEGRDIIFGGSKVHMHIRGEKGVNMYVPGDGSPEYCAAKYEHYDFENMHFLPLANPIHMAPDDRIRLECHYNNTEEYLAQFGVEPVDVSWSNDEGVTTSLDNEHCLSGAFFLSPRE